MSSDLEQRIVDRGKMFFEAIGGETPSVFNRSWWTGKVLDWSMKDEDFKVQLFRFVDVLPCLYTPESLSEHMADYFQSSSGDVPAVMKFGLKSAGVVGKLSNGLVAKGISKNIERMGRQFIIGQNAKEALKNLIKLRKEGFAFVINILGEATVSESEAEWQLREHMQLLDDLNEMQKKFSPLGKSSNGLDWGTEPMVSIAVKPTAFFSQARARDPEGAVEGMFQRLAPIYRKVIEIGGSMCIDMEALDHKEMTIELFKRLRSYEEFRDYKHLSLVFQCYLRETLDDIKDMVSWARKSELPIELRLVKGAYWDQETVQARQQGWDIPTYTIKADTDAAYERNARYVLENHDIVRLSCASHNIRTISAIMETAHQLNVPEERYEFQVLYGMGEPVRRGLKAVAGRVRLYCPYGDLIPGMAYLVRRLLENTSNDSFLRQGFVDGEAVEELLRSPIKKADEEREAKPAEKPVPLGELGPFRNEPMIDFAKPEGRKEFPEAIARIRKDLGKTYPLFINGKDVSTSEMLDSYNPSNDKEVIGKICQAGKEEVDQAVQAARKAFKVWGRTPYEERVGYLQKAAAKMRERIFDLASLQVLEIGKQWDQAYADVTEAIDFLEYYSREMLRLGKPRRMGRAPGEMNCATYRPKGVAAVIAPWNFPLAISTGMVSASLVTGNCVVYKPSRLSSVVGHGLVDIFREVGLPEGVFNYVPGPSSVMGDHLVGHPDVNLIAFTGSMGVGQRIIEVASKPRPDQHFCKKVVAEMGGKNACIVDDDAELDEALHHVIYSAFAFQGQKCSACSRVIVLDSVYDKFVERLVEAARSMPLGPSEKPEFSMGPVIDREAQKKVQHWAEVAEKEGNVLVNRLPESKDADLEAGCYAPLVVVDGITPDKSIAQEEIFGPVLSVMRAKDFDQAIEWLNSTRFALTAGVFSRSPRHLERVNTDIEAGNIYVNRNCTGALVERQPFGGFKMSGIGAKAGGPDYLIQFMDPQIVTENTVRRGFTPIEADDDWI
ncbi:proline dehydrogenase family protein [Desulfobaculum bizertense]|uniref:L-glutamate gamma-semialdehyde dehydrogenase n=1 Tax=Desulfobaculum bizertense DSM 18034 TaxID=1121442 RepID=A0A1T4VFJ1_9BACT|nr:proline dehydrogenase family protein [Desulfobaculum bizertense]UIJ37737.1 proline dehydrogenase family protein [Desulfobaculum bizertense]SKA63744.1 L-proline dehydrogenase [Desulfobaculum bizertense DSM 18034]